MFSKTFHLNWVFVTQQITPYEEKSCLGWLFLELSGGGRASTLVPCLFWNGRAGGKQWDSHFFLQEWKHPSAKLTNRLGLNLRQESPETGLLASVELKAPEIWNSQEYEKS